MWRHHYGTELSQALRASRLAGDLVNLSLSESTFTVDVKGPTDSIKLDFKVDDLMAIDYEAGSLSILSDLPYSLARFPENRQCQFEIR